jgi:two-component system sensor histidine kinase KdpD
MLRERIVVGLDGGEEGEVLVRRAAGILDRGTGGELLAVHVRTPEDSLRESPRALEAQRRLTVGLGGSYHTVAASDPARALLEFAGTAGASRILVGQSR